LNVFFARDVAGLLISSSVFVLAAGQLQADGSAAGGFQWRGRSSSIRDAGVRLHAEEDVGKVDDGVHARSRRDLDRFIEKCATHAAVQVASVLGYSGAGGRPPAVGDARADSLLFASGGSSHLTLKSTVGGLTA
jgi:hypothetical protein